MKKTTLLLKILIHGSLLHLSLSDGLRGGLSRKMFVQNIAPIIDNEQATYNPQQLLTIASHGVDDDGVEYDDTLASNG